MDESIAEKYKIKKTFFKSVRQYDIMYLLIYQKNLYQKEEYETIWNH